jgi:hypothetical protein
MRKCEGDLFYPLMSQKSYIVIHGTGGTLKQTVEMLSSIDSIRAKWFDGVFYTDKQTGLFLRKIISDADNTSPLTRAAQKLIIGRLLISCRSPENPENPEKFSSFDENRLIEQFPDFDIPYGPSSRMKTSVRLEKEGERDFLNAIGIGKKTRGADFAAGIAKLRDALVDERGVELSENEALAKIAEFSGSMETAQALLQLRDMGESGADLDTISSAAFYARALSGIACGENREFLQGRDYRFIFINYHQGLSHLPDMLAEPGDIYMADIPISTVPDLRSDAKLLRGKGFRIARYEDHHPYTTEQANMLKSLEKEGLVGFAAMSGPLQGEEVPIETLKCGGDMVYEALVMGRKYDNPAMAYLRKCVHGEDLAQERTTEGKILTELIKGGTNSIDIVQTLLSCVEEADVARKLAERGWENKIAEERKQVSKMESMFNDAIQVLEIERPAEDIGVSGHAMGFGSDMPAPPPREKKDKLKMLIVLSPYTPRGQPKLKIGRAQEYFARKMPDADYLLYCYGSSLIVGRRLNQADSSINLSVLMRKIGTENDGGHAGAAVCGPEKNPSYPKSILGRVNKGNFKSYGRYLEKHISEGLNLKVISRRDISVAKPSKAQESGVTQLIILTIATILIGLAVLFFNQQYRPAKIAEMNNKDFFVWFRTTEDKSADTVENIGVENPDDDEKAVVK